MAATLTLTTKFNLDTGKFNFVDTSNYGSQGSPDSGIKGCLSITGPSGLVYQHANYSNPSAAVTPDITTAGSYINNLINLPTDANGAIQKGTYTIGYKAYVTNGTDAGQTLTFTSTFDYEFTSPSVLITQVVNCFTAIFTSSDNSDYTVNGVTPTVTRSQNVTEVANPSRTNTTSSSASITVVYPSLYSGDYKTTISTLLLYDFTSYTVSVTVTGNSTYNVSCTSGNDVYCGIKGVYTNYKNYKAAGDIKAAGEALALWEQLISLYKQYEMAVNKGEDSDANSFIQDIQTIGGFSSTCSDSTGQIIPVTIKGDLYKTNSTTSVTIGLGVKTFTVPAGLSYQVGVLARATDAANPSNYINGPIVTYSGTSLSLSSINPQGSGTISNWNINIGS
jgi:hypothetical protein